jgi:putative membrane protein
MYTKKVFKLKDMVKWTRFETLLFITIITIFVSVYYFFDLHWLKIPWTPLALIGTAVAFVIGFQNNSAYGRIWEARKIWGGIVNSSRTFGMFVQDMVTNEHTPEKQTDSELQKQIKILTYRHIAWMTALRHAMRESKPWETVVHEKTNK